MAIVNITKLNCNTFQLCNTIGDVLSYDLFLLSDTTFQNPLRENNGVLLLKTVLSCKAVNVQITEGDNSYVFVIYNGREVVYQETVIVNCDEYNTSDLNTTKTDCSTFEVINPSIANLWYEIYVVTDLNNPIEGTLTEVPISENPLEIELPTNDGVYVIHYFYINGDSEINVTNYIAFKDCAINLCRDNYINNLVCKSETNCTEYCKEDKTIYNFIAFNLLYDIYVSVVATIAQVSFVYEVRSTIPYDQLGVTETIMTRMLNYCETCISTCNTCSS